MREVTANGMKVVALKIFSKHSKTLDALLIAGVYSSKSEVLRGAAWSLLDRVLAAQSNEGTDEHRIMRELVSNPDIDVLFNSKTKSVCGKFPLKMVAMIDWLVSQRLFKNRSEFFRDALNIFLASDTKIYSHFLLPEGIPLEIDLVSEANQFR